MSNPDMNTYTKRTNVGGRKPKPPRIPGTPLRKNWEAFARNRVLLNMTQVDAYMASGFKANRWTASKAGTVLANRPEVLARCAELRKEAMAPAHVVEAMTRAEAERLLTRWARGNAEEVNPLEALKELAKFKGWHAAKP